MKRERQEREHAIQRKEVTLRELKLVDKLQTNDILIFTYKDKEFVATLTAEAYIADAELQHHPRGIHMRNGAVLYDKPSNWTNDCVQAVIRESGTACKTNPSGYDRIIVKRLGISLNDLRNQYMQEFGIGAAPVLAPNDINMILEERKFAKRRRNGTGATDSSSASSTALDSVNKLRASGKQGYRNIAKHLERTLRQKQREFAKKCEMYEQIIVRLINTHDGAAAVPDAKMLLDCLRPSTPLDTLLQSSTDSVLASTDSVVHSSAESSTESGDAAASSSASSLFQQPGSVKSILRSSLFAGQ